MRPTPPSPAKFFGLEETRYEGPTGIAGVFQDACVQAGIPAVTFWAAVPHYVSPAAQSQGDGRAAAQGRDVLDVRGAARRPARRGRNGSERSPDDHRGRRDRQYVQSLEERGDAEVDMHKCSARSTGTRWRPNSSATCGVAAAEVFLAGLLLFQRLDARALVDRPSAAASASSLGNNNSG